MLNKTLCRRKLLFGVFLSFSDIDIRVNVAIFVPRIVTMVYVMSKNNLLSLQIVAIYLYFNSFLNIIQEDYHFSYNSKLLSSIIHKNYCNSYTVSF